MEPGHDPQGFSPEEMDDLNRLKGRRNEGEEADILSLAEMGFYRRCDLCGEGCPWEVCERCWQTVVEPRGTEAIQRMKRRWLEEGLPRPEGL